MTVVKFLCDENIFGHQVMTITEYSYNYHRDCDQICCDKFIFTQNVIAIAISDGHHLENLNTSWEKKFSITIFGQGERGG